MGREGGRGRKEYHMIYTNTGARQAPHSRLRLDWVTDLRSVREIFTWIFDTLTERQTRQRDGPANRSSDRPQRPRWTKSNGAAMAHSWMPFAQDCRSLAQTFREGLLALLLLRRRRRCNSGGYASSSTAWQHVAICKRSACIKYYATHTRDTARSLWTDAAQTTLGWLRQQQLLSLLLVLLLLHGCCCCCCWLLVRQCWQHLGLIELPRSTGKTLRRNPVAIQPENSSREYPGQAWPGSAPNFAVGHKSPGTQHDLWGRPQSATAAVAVLRNSPSSAIKKIKKKTQAQQN